MNLSSFNSKKLPLPSTNEQKVAKANKVKRGRGRRRSSIKIKKNRRGSTTSTATSSTSASITSKDDKLDEIEHLKAELCKYQDLARQYQHQAEIAEARSEQAMETADAAIQVMEQAKTSASEALTELHTMTTRYNDLATVLTSHGFLSAIADGDGTTGDER